VGQDSEDRKEWQVAHKMIRFILRRFTRGVAGTMEHIFLQHAICSLVTTCGIIMTALRMESQT
jgi:hypothetical protein